MQRLEEHDAYLLHSYKEKQSNEETLMHNLAEYNKKLKPYQRPLKDKNLTVENFKIKSLNEQAEFISSRYVLKTNYITTPRHSCLTNDLNQLKSICLKEMFVNKIHLGAYLECTTIVNPFYKSGMHLLIQDINQDYEHLVLYNFGSLYFDTKPETIIPIGTKLIIKEPNLQLLSSKENDFAIRVDSPSDLIILEYTNINSEQKSIEDLIKLGDKSYSESNYFQSVRFYSQAIEKSINLSAKAYLNRSLAYSKLEKHHSAYIDAKYASNLDTLNSKAYFQMGKSAYAIRKYDLALESFKECLKLDSSISREVELEIGRTNQRLIESKTGVYNFHQLYDDFFKRDNLFMDVADYTSSLIEITDIKDKFKGVLAKEPIKKGTLLVVSKAIVQTFYNKINYRHTMHDVINFSENNFRERNEAENFFHLAYKMQDDPYLTEQVYALFGGVQYSRECLKHPLIDIKRIELIYHLNSFQNLNSFDSIEVIELIKQARRLKPYNDFEFGDIDYSAIDFKSESFKKLADLQVRYEKLNKQCGLWLIPSYFNHACFSNCIMDYIGDVLLIYSIRDIIKGEELTIRYYPPELPYAQRQEHAKSGFEFKCDCKLCLLDEKDMNRSKRETLLYNLITKNAAQISVNQLLSELQKIRQTFVKRTELQLQMICPLETLAKKYRIISEYKKSVKYWLEIFDLIKDCNDFIAVGVMKEAYNDYKMCAQNKKAEECKSKAKEYFLNIYRQSTCFDELWKRIIFKGFNFNFDTVN